jgi:hypothetical protein
VTPLKSDPFAVRALREEVETLLRPPVKVRPSSVREQCEDRAAALWRAGLEASRMSNRQVADRVKRCERMVRDYATGARSVPLDAVLMMPRDAQLAIVRVLLQSLPETTEDDTDAQSRVA